MGEIDQGLSALETHTRVVRGETLPKVGAGAGEILVSQEFDPDFDIPEFDPMPPPSL